MTSFNWSKLRHWKTSQQDAFEELCCQLAHAEGCEGGSFVRNAPPDAGVECYWQLRTGEEWGWQAKFPRSGITTSLWIELDDSVKTALEKRPKLKRYHVCLPFSFSQGHVQRKTGKGMKRLKSARDRWNGRVKKWNEWAERRKRKIEFVLWDEHELWQRLSKDDHRGRRFFWFGDVVLDAAWFQRHVSASVQQAGARYDAALNIPVPGGRLFSTLARTPEFWNGLDAWAVNLQQALINDLGHESREDMFEERSLVRVALQQTVAAINSLQRNEAEILDFESVKASLEATSEACSRWEKRLRDLQNAADAEHERAHGHKPDLHENVGPSGWHTLRSVQRRLSETSRFITSDEGALVNGPSLLLTGEAGSGKTHLLCASAETLLFQSVPVVLLLGEQFHDAEPWNQILTGPLALNCTRDEFLGALDAAAEAAQTRAVIFIDGLNEGEGLKVWPRHLGSFLAHILRWPRLALAISVRTGYETAILRPEVAKHFTQATHRGFATVELEAATRFFEHFGIITPSVPVLSPDFSNPLFLKLFCRALQNAGLKEVPTGVRGITSVFNFFLETVNEKLSKPVALDFDPSTRVVQRAVDRLAELMVGLGSSTLPLDVVQSELTQSLPRPGYEKSLERALRVEGVLARQPEFSTMPPSEVVHFAYQRFTDHRIIGLLLRSVKRGKERKFFAKRSKFWRFVNRASWYWKKQGLWDALAIQLPELVGREIPDLLPQMKDLEEVRDSFLASIIWRSRSAFTDRTAYWVEYYRGASKQGYAKTLDALLAVSTCIDHPFNAGYLHRFLLSEKMPNRDARWSIFLFQEYGEGRSVDRLIEWALSEQCCSGLDDQTASLAAIPLTWFFSTSNRFLRDRVTKSVVSLLEGRLAVACKLLRQFKEVDDPYVLERLYAAAFGTALRSEDHISLKALAQQVFDDIFKEGRPPPPCRAASLRTRRHSNCAEPRRHDRSRRDPDVSPVSDGLDWPIADTQATGEMPLQG